MTNQKDNISYRALSVAQFVDRLKPGEYVIRLIWPPRHYAQPFEIKADPVDLTEKNERAIKASES